MKLPPLPDPVDRIAEPFGSSFLYDEDQMREYAAAAYKEALEQAAQLVELEYAKDHQGVLRLKQIAKHILTVSPLSVTYSNGNDLG